MLRGLAALPWLLLPPTAEAQVWSYVQFFDGAAEWADAENNVVSTSVTAGDVSVSNSFNFPIAHPTGEAYPAEAGNLAMAGRDFVEWYHTINSARTLTIYAVEAARVVVNEIGSGGSTSKSQDLNAGDVGEIEYSVRDGADIAADGDVLLYLRYGNNPVEYNYPLVPAAAVIFGVCSQVCNFATPGAAAAKIHQVCQDESTAEIDANAWQFESKPLYTAPVCRYEAPAGYTIAGHQNSAKRNVAAKWRSCVTSHGVVCNVVDQGQPCVFVNRATAVTAKE